MLGEDISRAKYVKAGNHTSPEIWGKYGHLVDPKLLPQELVPKDFDFTPFGASCLQKKKHGISQESMDILVDPYAFPLMAESLSDLPPAFVLTCQLDPLRDEGILYAQRLKQDGVSVEHYQDKHGFHGMMSLNKGLITFQAAVDAIDAIVKFLERKD